MFRIIFYGVITTWAHGQMSSKARLFNHINNVHLPPDSTITSARLSLSMPPDIVTTKNRPQTECVQLRNMTGAANPG